MRCDAARLTKKHTAMRWNDLEEQQCSVARAVSVLGDRWTLLIIRDCFLRVRRFEQFQSRLGIARRVLAERLDKLVEKGVLKRVAYQERPLREEYRLTEMGLDLHPVVLSLVHWGDKHLSGDQGVPVLHRRIRAELYRACPDLTCSECGEPVEPRAVRPRKGPGLDPNNPLLRTPPVKSSAASG